VTLGCSFGLGTLEITHFRSISHAEIRLGHLNAFVGPNSAGKSTILDALNIILGETWPSRPFDESDYHNYDKTIPIEIIATFDTPLQCDHDVCGFRLRQDANTVQFNPIDSRGNVCTYGRGGRDKFVTKEMRSEVGLLYLGLDRQAEKQLRATQWTLYGKLIQAIESRIDPNAREAFRAGIQDAYTQNLAGGVSRAEAIINDFVQRQTGLGVRLEFNLLDPVQMMRGIRPQIVEDVLTLDPEQVGAGVQSAVCIGISQAYSQIVRTPMILAIEEPELYLHPHGCRHFYNLLRELSDGNLQVIYTTHERSFVNAGDFESIHIVRKTGGETGVASGLEIRLRNPDPLRLQSRFNERINEVFFSSCAVLVEGESDEIACKASLRSLGVDLDRSSISVLAVGGVTEMPPFSELLQALGIPTICISDEDPGNRVTAAAIAQVQAVLGAPNVFLCSPNLEGVWALRNKPSRIEAMSVFPQAVARGVQPDVYVQVQRRIQAIT
jgi:putative ATP-dependent endonuclease of the OLD family